MATSETVLITGCSSPASFGYLLSIHLLTHPTHQTYNVILTSRSALSPAQSAEISSLGGKWLQLDVTAPEAVIAEKIKEAEGLFGNSGIDVLINNAGVGVIGSVEDTSLAEAQKIMETNFYGPLKLIQAVVPGMRAKQRGTIMSVSAAAAAAPRAGMGVYGASKCALEGLSESLSKELSPFGIRVLVIQPGYFPTNMLQIAPVTAKPISSQYVDSEMGKFVEIFRSQEPGGREMKGGSDVQKGVQAMFEVVTGTGRAVGKEEFLRVPLSRDCAVRVRTQIEGLEKGLEAWREVWEGTGLDEV
ncbi:hypothetical protein B7494_g4383 [Chlorociboria aeruginascens]|nr:hypothetical protein B7494_g4383 [Chlorociboria aeruginascens]